MNRCCKFIILLLLLSFSLRGAQKQFSFSNFTQLKNKQSFTIKGKRHIDGLAGKGRVIQLSNKKLQMNFEAFYLAQSIKAEMTLTLVKKKNRDYQLKFVYHDNLGRSTSKINEIVKADGFMADRGMLTFAYNKGKNYFQMRIDPNSQENWVVLSWGTCQLEKL